MNAVKWKPASVTMGALGTEAMAYGVGRLRAVVAYNNAAQEVMSEGAVYFATKVSPSGRHVFDRGGQVAIITRMVEEGMDPQAALRRAQVDAIELVNRCQVLRGRCSWCDEEIVAVAVDELLLHRCSYCEDARDDNRDN